MYGESPHSIPSKIYQVPQASPRIADRPVVGPHISSTDAISDTQIMLRWTVSTTSIRLVEEGIFDTPFLHFLQLQLYFHNFGYHSYL